MSDLTERMWRRGCRFCLCFWCITCNKFKTIESVKMHATHTKKYFSDQNFCFAQICLEPIFWMGTKFFLIQTFETQNFLEYLFYPKFFLTQFFSVIKFFFPFPKYIYVPKNCWTQFFQTHNELFWPKIVQTQNCFWDQIFFWTQNEPQWKKIFGENRAPEL